MRTSLSLFSLHLATAAMFGICTHMGCSNDPGPGIAPESVVTRSQPSLRLIWPDAESKQGGGEVLLEGQGFRPGMSVSFGGQVATAVTVLSPTQARVVVPRFSGASGLVEVILDNPDGGQAKTQGLFSYLKSIVTLSAPITRPVGASPVAMAAEDINQDGEKDLLVVGNRSNNVTILLSNNDYQPQPVAVPTLPTALALGDINLDGRTDLVVGCANAQNQDLAVLRGNGNGTFSSPVVLAAGTPLTALSVRDMDGDGKVDVVVTNRSTSQALVLTNASVAPGVAFRGSPASLAVSVDPVAMVLADLDNNGQPDLLTAGYASQSLTAVLGSSPLLPVLVQAPLTSHPVGLAVADVTGDRRLDVLTANFDASSVSVFALQGDKLVPRQHVPVGAQPASVRAADLDGDGWQDLVVASSGVNQLWILLSDGKGGFEPAQRVQTGTQPWALEVTDLDRDNRPDLAFTNLGAGTVSLAFNRGVR